MQITIQIGDEMRRVVTNTDKAYTAKELHDIEGLAAKVSMFFSVLEHWTYIREAPVDEVEKYTIDARAGLSLAGVMVMRLEELLSKKWQEHHEKRKGNK